MEEEITPNPGDNKLVKYIAGGICSLLVTGLISFYQSGQANSEKLVRLDERLASTLEKLTEITGKIDGITEANKVKEKEIETRIQKLEIETNKKEE